jgi:hypothetical protein
MWGSRRRAFRKLRQRVDKSWEIDKLRDTSHPETFAALSVIGAIACDELGVPVSFCLDSVLSAIDGGLPMDTTIRALRAGFEATAHLRGFNFGQGEKPELEPRMWPTPLERN